MNKKEQWSECDVCKIQYKNHAGSTPCCGAIAYHIENKETCDNCEYMFKCDSYKVMEGTILDRTKCDSYKRNKQP